MMRIVTGRQLLLSLACLTGFISAGGQKQSDSLLSYMEIAARNNPVVMQKFNEYQAALQKVPQAGALPDPELDAGVFIRPMELVSGKQVADIRLMQMFPWFGTLKNARDETSLMARSRYESFRDARLQLFYDMQRTWYELYRIRQNIRITNENIGLLQTIERLSIIKFKTASTGSGGSSPEGSIMPGAGAPDSNPAATGMQGMGINQGNSLSANTFSSQPPVQGNPMESQTNAPGLPDIYRIQIEISDLANDLALLENKERTIISRFNSFLDREPGSAISVPDTLVPDSLPVMITAVSDSMLANNPMLAMLQYEKLSLEARGKMIDRMGYPMTGLGLDYMVINRSEMSASPMNGKDMIMPMVSITIPVYRKKFKAMRSEADYLQIAAEQNYEATTRALQTEYFEAMQLFQDAGRRRKLYQDQYRLAEQSYRVILKNYTVSGSGLADILQVRRQLLDYRYKQVEALVDYNTAIAWFKRLMAASAIYGI